MVSFSYIIDLLTILGSLMLFLFGMKLMSEAMQSIIGKRLKQLFSGLVSNRFKAIVTGILITGIIQSSSAITVVLVSFVNAGIFSLTQGLGIMMGANIGTTVTAWLVTFFGFKFEFTNILLPILGLSLPLLFLHGAKSRSYGELILGFAILFLGLQFMKNSLPNIDESSPIVVFISSIAGHGLGSLLLFALSGLIITLIIQSSSATITLTFVLCANGYISFEAAAAMILGENLGTTVTANVAAIVANRAAKRIALGHTLFNLFGLIWVFILFVPIIRLTENIALWIAGYNHSSEYLIPVGLSLFHTSFNILNTILLVGFIPILQKILEKLILLRPNEKKNFRLRYFKSRFIAVNEVDIMQAHEQISYFGRHVANMFSLIPLYLTEKRNVKIEKIQKKLFKLEDDSDNLDREITDYITRIAENDLSEANSRKIRAMLKITDDLESIADQCLQMERTIRKKNEAKAWFTQEMRDDLSVLFLLVKNTLNTMNENLSRDYRPGILSKATENELKINEMRDKLIQSNRQRLEAGEYNYKHASFYAELLNQCEKLADHVINVNQAIASNSK
ncbi:MAG: Na/Pi cotransporter family protein [Lentimicrobium sp.]|nr:Na/Pi cotransporter family protein [Lentimicrobium sp.]